MVEVGLDKLPASFADTLGKGRFLVAYHLPDLGQYVAQYVETTGARRELAYDVVLDRRLTTEERRAALPRETREALPESDLTIVTRHVLDDEVGERRVQFDAIDPAGNTVASVSKAVHVPVVWDGKQLIKEALHRQRFPASYATWPRPQKVAHWAATLHRFRRAHGESGRDEDEVYTPALVSEMEKTDPQVRSLLPDILAQVGALEQTPADQAVAAFAARTGIVIG